MQAANMSFLGYSVVVIRRGFIWKHENAKDAEEKYKLAKRELHTIVKLGVIMGNYSVSKSIRTQKWGCCELVLGVLRS